MMDTVYTSSWTLAPNPSRPCYRPKDGLRELNDLQVFVQLEDAGTVLQTRLASSKMLLKFTPMTCGPVSLL